MTRLDDRAVADALASLPGWTRDGAAIRKSYRRRGWKDAIAFVDRVAAEAERRNHHPDLCMTGYRNVTVTLTSHDAGGITERDVGLARWIEETARTEDATGR